MIDTMAALERRLELALMNSPSPRLQSNLFKEARSWADLTPNERNVLLFVEAAAREDRELESNEEIAARLGFDGTGTVRGIMLRLEKKNYVKIECYQRGRRAFAASIGKWTAKPACTQIHWRHVYDRSKDSTPTVPKQRIDEHPTIMAAITRLMRERNVSMPDAQIMLMAFGVTQVAALHAVEG